MGMGWVVGEERKGSVKVARQGKWSLCDRRWVLESTKAEVGV